MADIVRSIPGASDEESSKLTIFLLPSGRYRYLCLSMGLSSLSHEWCRHSNRAIQGLPFTKKIMDDILVWGSSFPKLYDKIRVIASRCSDLNIALSKKKFVISNEISFACLLLTEKGVKPEPVRISALPDFPVTILTDASGLHGLGNPHEVLKDAEEPWQCLLSLAVP